MPPVTAFPQLSLPKRSTAARFGIRTKPRWWKTVTNPAHIPQLGIVPPRYLQLTVAFVRPGLCHPQHPCRPTRAPVNSYCRWNIKTSPPPSKLNFFFFIPSPLQREQLLHNFWTWPGLGHYLSFR